VGELTRGDRAARTGDDAGDDTGADAIRGMARGDATVGREDERRREGDGSDGDGDGEGGKGAAWCFADGEATDATRAAGEAASSDSKAFNSASSGNTASRNTGAAIISPTNWTLGGTTAAVCTAATAVGGWFAVEEVTAFN
jgi:hypothetical protein